MHEILHSDFAYAACFRNYRATIDWLAENHESVVLIGAGTRGEFREEDQMCCAWIANGLIEAGFSSKDATTEYLVQRWKDSPQDAFLMSRSVDYLRRSGQLRDLSFILGHFDDIDFACKLGANEVTSLAVAVEV
jgi:2-phosphosulfolactate phosphatase